jgi:ribonuclease-3
VTWNFLKGTGLLLHPKKESYFALYKILGFFPRNITFYEEALLHKSFSGEKGNQRYRNNERLEFLGDAVLDAVVADIVFKKFKKQDEGFLTTTRSKIVKRETLDKISLELGLSRLVISSSQIKAQKNHVLGNALEAFIGAIYLDRGYRKTYRFIDEKIIKTYINLETLAKKEMNFKSKLLEWGQKFRVKLDFNLLENFTDPDNNPVFQSQVLLNGLLAGVGSGYSKKESQQQAAQMALKKIKTDKIFVESVLNSGKKEISLMDSTPCPPEDRQV